MLKNLWLQVLMDEAPPDGGGGGGGGNAPPVFDHAKFTADSDRRFKAIEKQNTDLLAALNGLKPKDPAADEPEDKNKGGDKKDPALTKLEKELAKMRTDLDTERKGREEATNQARSEKRTNTLTQELGKLGVAPERIKSALRAVDPDVKFSDDGTLVGEDDSPLAEYLTTWIKGNDHFLPPKQVGGAGATGGLRRGEKPLQLEDIKPGMKPEDMARARQLIADLARQAQNQ